MVLSLVVFGAGIALVMVRPRPLNEGTAAAIGALLMVVLGVVSLPQAIESFRANLNVLLFFTGLMVISAIADQAGFFRWGAFKAVQMAGGSGRRLLLVIFGLGTLVTAFLSNDSTALILTPIVYSLVTRLKLNPLPYVFACAFIANSASILLPVSNPVNLLAVDRFGLTLGDYLRHLLLPSLLIVSANILLFLWIFKNDLPASFGDGLPEPVKIDGFFVFVCVALGLTAVGYVVASGFGLPLSVPALSGAALLVIGGKGYGRLSFAGVRAGFSWSILLFIFSLAVMVTGIENAGVIDRMGFWLSEMAAKGSLYGMLSMSLATAIGSNLINNWSMMMVSVSSLDAMAPAAFQPGLVYAAILGADLGPNIAILGSLSSMLWLVLLAQRGLHIHPVQYLKLGLLVTPPMLLLGALALYLSAL